MGKIITARINVINVHHSPPQLARRLHVQLLLRMQYNMQNPCDIVMTTHRVAVTCQTEQTANLSTA